MQFTFVASFIAAAAALVSAADTGLVSFLAGQTSGSTAVTTLVSLVSKQPAILSALSSTVGPITVFAPTDDAFKAFLANPPAGFDATNATQVADVLSYHVAATLFKPNSARAFIDTLRPNPSTGGSPTQIRADFNSSASSVALYFGLNSSNVISSSPVTLQDMSTMKTGNAIVHFIDTVLVPPTDAATTASAVPILSTLVSALAKANLVSAVTGAQNITILAPVNTAFGAINSTVASLTTAQLSNVLTFHVISGIFRSTDLIAAGASLSNVPTLFTSANLTESNDGTTIKVAGAGNTNPAKVIISDVLIANGVVHVIDTVLLPSLSSLGVGSTTITTSPTVSVKNGASAVSAGSVGALAAAAIALML